MKRIHSTLLWLATLASPVLAQYADSVWLDYKDGLVTSGDVIMTDMQVEVTALYTYYAGLVWNNGYMGLQRGGNGYYKHVHFSVWDPPGGGFADLVSAGPGVVVERFGGEGTGWKAMWPFSWVENTRYRLCVALTYTGGVTDYTAWFFDPAAGAWKQIATFRRSDALHTFSYAASFVEDFGGTLNSRRSCLFGNAWLRTFPQNWIDLRTATYATGGSRTNKDADVVGDLFRLETGGQTTNDTPAYTILTRPRALIPPTDQDPRISSINNGQSISLRWQTLPWRTYYLEATTNVVQWLPTQSQAAVSNVWVQAVSNNTLRFYRTRSYE